MSRRRYQKWWERPQRPSDPNNWVLWAIGLVPLLAILLFSALAMWEDAHGQSTDPYLQDLREDGARTMMRTCHYELEILEMKGRITNGGDWYACLAHYAGEASRRHKHGASYKMKPWGRTAVPGGE